MWTEPRQVKLILVSDKHVKPHYWYLFTVKPDQMSDFQKTLNNFMSAVEDNTVIQCHDSVIDAETKLPCMLILTLRGVQDMIAQELHNRLQSQFSPCIAEFRAWNMQQQHQFHDA